VQEQSGRFFHSQVQKFHGRSENTKKAGDGRFS